MPSCPYNCGTNHRHGPTPTNCDNYPKSKASAQGAGGVPAASTLTGKSVLGQDSGEGLAARRDRDSQEVKAWMKDNASEIDAELCMHPDWDEKKDDLREAAQYVGTLKHPESSAQNIRSGTMSAAGLAELAFEHHSQQEGYRAQAAQACRDHDIDDMVDEAAYSYGVEDDSDEVRRRFDKELHDDAGAFLDWVESKGAETAIKDYAENIAEEIASNPPAAHQTSTPTKAEMQDHKYNTGYYKDER